jgi:hypothetical protein
MGACSTPVSAFARLRGYILRFADERWIKTIMDVLCKGIHNGVEQAKSQGLMTAAR